MCQSAKATRLVVDAVEGKYRSAVFAGITPDKRHLDAGGYHVCLTHLKSHGRLGDYSSTRPLDKAAAVTAAGEGYSCALDVSLSPADMKRLYASVKRVHGDKSDPRRKYVNAINCWRGSGAAQRFNFQTGSVGEASPDHKSHTHADQPRAYVDDVRDPAEAAKAGRALASIMTGESRAAWTAREEPRPPAPDGKTPTTPGTVKPTTWPVKAGDTLSEITSRTGVPVASLQKWNGLQGTTIYVGQTLRLTAPPAKPVPESATLKPPPWPIGARDFYRPRAGAPAVKTVGQWQARMRAMGWPIVADNYLGPKSGGVLVDFQRVEGLKVTRVLDKATFDRAWKTARRHGK